MKIFLSILFLILILIPSQAAHVLNKYGMVLLQTSDGYSVKNYDVMKVKVPNIDLAPDLYVPWTYIPEKIKPEEMMAFTSHTVVYKRYKDYELDLKIDLPVNVKNAPILYYIHGGGYANGDNNQFAMQAKYFASHGIAVVRPAYSLDNKVMKADYDKTITDLRDAMEYMRIHAKEFGVDPARFAFSGISAGAHLASYMGLTTPNTACVIPMAGFGDMTIEVNRFKNRSYMAKYYPNNIEAISPVHLVQSTSPAFLIVQGTGDHVVMHEHSVMLYRKFCELGLECELLLYPFLVHNIPASMNCYYEDYMTKMLALLTKKFF